MKINHASEWMVPFFEIAFKLPELTRLKKRVKSLTIERPRATTVKAVFGWCTEDRGIFNIVVQSHKTVCLRRKPLKMTTIPFSTIEMLEVLSHEIAHVKHMIHSPDHMMLEAKLKTMMMKKLKRDGYKSDEIYHKKAAFYG